LFCKISRFWYDSTPSAKHAKGFVAACCYGRDLKDHYVLDTTAGPVRVTNIDFEGELSINQTDIPLSQFSEYRRVGSKEPVSQTASFEFPVKGQTATLELHHLTESGHVAIRLKGAPPAHSQPKAKNS